MISYHAPTPIEVRDIMKALDLSGAKAAEQTGMKKSRIFRNYTAEGAAHAPMPYSVLFTLIAKNVGRFIPVDGWREVLYQERILINHKRDCT